MTDVAYDSQFYADISDGSRRSAAVVVPLVLRLLPTIRSVVDFGCGSGTWLAEFSLCGVGRVTGLDFGEGTREFMFIPRERFRVANLAGPVTDVPRHDLAMSVEVAEHLPESAAATFVESLTATSDLVMFSAAIPLQGGHNHVNERWPGFWIQLFEKRGYRCHDVLRPMLWDDKRVEWWYRQNLLLFVKAGAAVPALDGLPTFGGRDLVHPERLVRWASPAVPAAAVPSGTGAPGGGEVDHAALALRLAPRSPPLRVLAKALLSSERALRRIGSLVAGRPKDAFRRDWAARVDARLVRRSGLFDGEWYCRAYPDVVQSGMEPFEHFAKIGLRERRDPGPSFSSERYAAQRPWLAAYDDAPLVHFLRALRDRRSTTPRR